ncbi:Nn.00g045450.m01.CDS01 [Neocucurbitaria sp. VM-36]
MFPSNSLLRIEVTWSQRVVWFKFWFRDFSNFANSNPQDHEYTSLKNPNDFRVVLLYPRFGSGRVCCSLLQGPHMRNLCYEAISYKWDLMDATEEILVDGYRKKVTKSVYEIHTSYSSLFLPKLLWIDALCINQQNDAEKSQQVPLMEQIYQKAIFTTVFLGRSPLPDGHDASSGTLLPFRYDGFRPIDRITESFFEDSRLTFDLLKELYVLKGNVLWGPDMSVYQFLESLRLSASKRRQWAAILKMLHHPWFERIWVIQEVALSSEGRVRYGDEIIDWKVLANGVRMLQRARHFRIWLELEHSVQLSHPNLFNVSSIHQFRKKKSTMESKTFDLASVLEKSSYFKATNLRDLIFGVMLLCQMPLKFDYALSVEDIYMCTAKRLLEEGAIEILFHSSGVGNRHEEAQITCTLPSWVPDWRATPKHKRLQNKTNPFGGGGGGGGGKFTAGGKGALVISLTDHKFLGNFGYLVDAVTVLGPALFNTSDTNQKGIVDEIHHLAVNHAACVRLLFDSTHLSARPYPHGKPGQSLTEAFRRTICLNQARWNTLSLRFVDNFLEWEKDIMLFCDHGVREEFAEKQDAFYELLKSIDDVTQIIKSCCGGQRIFITESGYIGLCPPYAKLRDLVYVVPGFHVPIMLRLDSLDLEGQHTPDPATRVKLVGESYVHGIMDGEILSKSIVLEALRR